MLGRVHFKELFVTNMVSYARVIPSLLLIALIFGPQSAQADDPHYKYMGTGSCSSSNCHGSVNKSTSSAILQNEYTTWQKHDKHSQAYLTLLNQESRTIAGHLGINKPEEEPLCLRCHATYVPDKELRGEKYQIEDGVSCESCHGAASAYLETHSISGATYKDDLAKGMADLVPLDKRANACLSCHYGTDEKTVNHNLYGAGHPRLSFELDTFGVLQPKHWEVDDDYRKRKEDYLPIRAWLVGQAVHARAVLNAIDSPKRSKNGVFPELSLFDCYSCHHSLTEDQWKTHSNVGEPGELHLNLPSLVILREALVPFSPKLADSLKAGIADLHANYKNDGGKRSIPGLKKLVGDDAMSVVASVPADPAKLQALLKQLVEFGARTPFLKYEVAEQLGMGMQAVLATSPELAKTYKSGLDSIYSTLKSAEAFSPEAFTKACKEMAGKMGV